MSSLKPFLVSTAKHSKMQKLERDLRAVRESLLEGSPKARGDLLKLESDLVERMKQEVYDATVEATSSARVVVCTNMQAMQASIRRQVDGGLFDLVCLDEAGFATDGNLLHLLPGAKKIILGEIS